MEARTRRARRRRKPVTGRTHAERGPYEGLLNIVRFNWPMFATAVVLVTTAFLWAALTAPSLGSRVGAMLALVAVAATAFSLAVSHVVYDRSDLYGFTWINRAIEGLSVRNALFCQTGFDECSARLIERLPTAWSLLDHFDPRWMTEPSIRRARLRCPPARGTVPAPFDAWPTPTASVDLIIGMLAIHELRSEAERGRWFAEARRSLRPDGRVVVAEHVRDVANFLAFGPGALHFHSPSSWRRSWESASLRARDEFRVTPWVRIFVLEPQ